MLEHFHGATPAKVYLNMVQAFFKLEKTFIQTQSYVALTSSDFITSFLWYPVSYGLWLGYSVELLENLDECK